MTIPVGEVPVPAVALRIAAGRPVKAVWHNVVGGQTFQIGHGDGREFVKVAPPHPSVSLHGEAVKLRWATPYLTVPRVLGVGRDGTTAWLHTAGIAGRSAADPHWIARPQLAVRAIATGLRAMHDGVPVDQCPFSWSVSDRLAAMPEAAHRDLPAPPPIDRLVVCHGDACAPNTLISAEGRWCGHVDLGELGVADRWADLAVATLSLGWNYPGDWEAEFFDAYGVAPDPMRIDYYRRLWTAED
ncbi:kanamycin kinase [Mycobacterium frederiksbergense]|uniref:Kanamycin kinase n=1 Tax=Mycolicibacterium frederiksbergense TaxID=117567 RepID=A0ABT6KX85_9MYCO|nr:aminoglycoside 3'-phosphotransferase [Mycolicibacterium frederiksbergense]MDH6195322.1 kanamycin kinase [Mycolicibacterium frederiksbergense]